ncbi:MAG: hypothetical protein J5825_01975 [Lachnospiraceae bacterium]|nr:hypothetical protein [Lachnospiraceae bacterium]
MKKFLLLILRIAIRLLPLGFCYITKHWCDVNETFALVSTILWIAAISAGEFLLRKKNPEHKLITVLTMLTSVVIILLMIWSTVFDPEWNSCSMREGIWNYDSGNAVLTRKEAIEDLDYVMKYLKKVHPLTKDGLPEEIAAKEKEVREWLNTQDTMEGYRLSRELERILAPLEDGHTHAYENYLDSHRMKHIYEHNLKGDTLVGINGITFEEYLKAEPDLRSYDHGMEAYGVRLIKNRIGTLEGLKYMGIDISGDIVYNYITKDGEEENVTVRAEDFLCMEEYLDYETEVTGVDLRTVDDQGKAHGFVYYEIDEELSLAVLTITSCNYNDFYKQTVKDLFREVEEKKIRNIAVDLRSNSGGSSWVATEFISYLAVDTYRDWGEELRLNPLIIKSPGGEVKNSRKGAGFDGNVYVLTGVSSFSSAMDFAMLIGDNDLGTIIGQPCGNLPSGYGDIVRFQLPNSKIVMQVSMKKWHRVDESKEEEPLTPDVICPENEALEVMKELIK